jgi:hypothetical protein
MRFPRDAHGPLARRDPRYNPKSPLGGLFRPGNLVNQNAGAGNNWTKDDYTRAGHEFCLTSLLCSGFVVNSDSLTETRPSVRVYVGPELARCVHKNCC